MYIIKSLLGVFCNDEAPKMSHSFKQMDFMLSTHYGWIHIGSGVVAKMQVFLITLMRVTCLGVRWCVPQGGPAKIPSLLRQKSCSRNVARCHVVVDDHVSGCD